MEALQALKERRCIRSYRAEQIKDEQLNKILEAGTYAPSGMGRQSATMVVVQNADMIAKLSAMNAAVMGKDGNPFYGAPTVVIVFGDPEKSPTWFEDACLVMGNLMNAAWAVGVDSCWIHRAKQVFSSDEGKALMKKWGVSESCVGVGHCILGYAAVEHPAAAPRRADYILRV